MKTTTAWTSLAVVDMSLTELSQQTGRMTPELDSGGCIRLVNRKARRVIGYVVPPGEMPESLRGAEDLIEPPAPQHTRGRVYYGRLREMVTTGDLGALPAAAAARVLGVPERTVHNWRAARNGASA
jgi:hypothetical protein